MKYELRIDVKGDVLWVTATGERTLETVLSMAQDIIAACFEKNCKKILIDVLGLRGHLGEMDDYNVPAQYFPRLRERGVITSCAIVDQQELREHDTFFENVAVNRGFNLRIFSDTNEAVAWLKK